MPFTFPASGAGETVTGPVTILRAVIDLNNNGVIDVGETDILTNAAAVNSVAVAQAGNIKVLVEIQANAGALPGVYTSKLGDNATDDVVDDATAGGVKTSDATAVNGIHEAVGSFNGTIVKDSQVQITAVVPAGPVSPGATVLYTTQTCNPTDRPVECNDLSRRTRWVKFIGVHRGTDSHNIRSCKEVRAFRLVPCTALIPLQLRRHWQPGLQRNHRWRISPAWLSQSELR